MQINSILKKKYALLLYAVGTINISYNMDDDGPGPKDTLINPDDMAPLLDNAKEDDVSCFLGLKFFIAIFALAICAIIGICISASNFANNYKGIDYTSNAFIASGYTTTCTGNGKVLFSGAGNIGAGNSANNGFNVTSNLPIYSLDSAYNDSFSWYMPILVTLFIVFLVCALIEREALAIFNFLKKAINTYWSYTGSIIQVLIFACLIWACIDPIGWLISDLSTTFTATYSDVLKSVSTGVTSIAMTGDTIYDVSLNATLHTMLPEAIFNVTAPAASFGWPMPLNESLHSITGKIDAISGIFDPAKISELYVPTFSAMELTNITIDPTFDQCIGEVTFTSEIPDEQRTQFTNNFPTSDASSDVTSSLKSAIFYVVSIIIGTISTLFILIQNIVISCRTQHI